MGSVPAGRAPLQLQLQLQQNCHTNTLIMGKPLSSLIQISSAQSETLQYETSQKGHLIYLVTYV